MTVNPFFEVSTLPYRLPPFADIRDTHFGPAFERGMAEQLGEIESIVAETGPPTFENTVVALERSGALLRRVELVFFNKTASDTNELVQALEAELSPKLAAHRDAITLNGALYARIKGVYEARAGLDTQELRLVERYHTEFVRAGAQLAEAQKEELRALNEQLAELSTTFEQNLFADTKARSLLLESADELAGLSEDAIAAAAKNGTERGYGGKYLLSLQLPSNQPELASLVRRDVRERLLAASLGRGGETNGDVVVRSATLRARQAALLGYESHAAYQVANRAAGTVAAVEELLGQLVPAAVANAQREAEALRDSFAQDGHDAGDFAAWDWQYYSEKVRKERFDVDAAALRPYFELERTLRDGAFFAAEKVYGITFRERGDLVAYHPDARVFEVFDADGSALGLFIGDYYARASKRGGAWMNELVYQVGLFGTKPVVVNNMNIAKPPAGEPTLLTFDQVNTLFHEFGHALHGLFSAVRYPKLSGTDMANDFVEYPSQVNEMWSVWPEVLANYARHVETGEPLPAALVERMAAAERFGQGFKTVEYLGAVLLDWAWHTIPAGAEPGDPPAFEAAALTAAGIAFPEIPPRYRSTYLAHAFSFGYSAGYYAYIWSEVLDADTVEWFKENGGMTRANGEVFRRELLSRGDTVDPRSAYRAFRGRDPQLGPLLARRGLN